MGESQLQAFLQAIKDNPDLQDWLLREGVIRWTWPARPCLISLRRRRIRCWIILAT